MSADKAPSPKLPPKPSVLEALRRAFFDNRFWRISFTREKLIDAAKNLAWVGPLTLLIWVWAEREQTQEPTVSDVPIQIVTSDRSLFVKAATENPRSSLTLKGPQSGLDKVREQLSAGIPRGVEIDVGNSLGRGNGQQINVVDRIQNLPIFKDNGVTITKADPSELAVNVDSLWKPELEVQIPRDVSNLTLATTFEPRKIQVSGPETLLRRLESQGLLKVYADISHNEALTGPPGKHDIGAVSVSLPAAVREEDVSISPTAVHATLDVLPADVEFTIPSVPITIDATPVFADAYHVSLTNGDTVASVVVSGPADKIELIKGGQYPVEARLKLDRIDAVKDSSTKALIFDLPDGVHLQGPPRTADFRINKRDNPVG